MNISIIFEKKQCLAVVFSGEVERSYGFDGRGRIVTGGKEEVFAESFTEGDVIGCYAVRFRNRCT